MALCSLFYGYCVGLVIVARLRWWPWVDLSWLPDGLPSVQNKSPAQIRNSTGLSSTWLYPWNMFTNREYHPVLKMQNDSLFKWWPLSTYEMLDTTWLYIPDYDSTAGHIWLYIPDRTVTVPLDTSVTVHTGLWQYRWTPMWLYIPDQTVTVQTNEINIFMFRYTKCYFWDKGRLVFGDIPIKYINVV